MTDYGYIGSGGVKLTSHVDVVISCRGFFAHISYLLCSPLVIQPERTYGYYSSRFRRKAWQ
jgi:hypothetical protein